MSESNRLVAALKYELRKQGKTYADLTGVLSLSHASVKRLFAEESFSLQRVEEVCRFLGMDFAELVNSMERQADRIDHLTDVQEQELVKDKKFLCLAHSLLNRWTFEEVIGSYAISEIEGIHYMAMLDRMKLIEMLPGNRYRLLVSRKFRWIPGGPIQQFFDAQLQADFLDTSFNKPDEFRVFISSMLSKGAVEELNRRLGKLVNEINELHLGDESLALKDKQGISVLLAARPWETKVFAALRRQPNTNTIK